MQVHSSQISFNTSKSTYQIVLTATVPVFNPNYLPVSFSCSDYKPQGYSLWQWQNGSSDQLEKQHLPC
jgi:hypothetical protein